MHCLSRNIPLLYAINSISALHFDRGIFILYLLYAGLSDAQISALQIWLFLLAMLAEIPSGLFADSFGRRVSMLCSALSMAIYAIGMTYAQDFWLFFILFGFAALSFSLATGASTAMLYDSLKALKKREDFVKVNARMMTVNNLAFALAVMLGGFLQEWGGWPLVYGTYLVSNILTALLILFLLEPPYDEAHQAQSSESYRDKLHDYKRAFCEPALRRLLLFMTGFAIFEAMITPLYIYSQKLLAGLGLETPEISLTYGAIELIAAGSFLFAPWIEKRWGVKRFFYFAIVFTMLSMGFLLSNQASVVVLALIILFSLPEARRPLQESYMNNRIPSDIRASLISTDSMIDALLTVTVYAYYGWALGHLEIAPTILSTIVLCPLALAVLWFYFQKETPEIDEDENTE